MKHWGLTSKPGHKNLLWMGRNQLLKFDQMRGERRLQRFPFLSDIGRMLNTFFYC